MRTNARPLLGTLFGLTLSVTVLAVSATAALGQGFPGEKGPDQWRNDLTSDNYGARRKTSEYGKSDLSDEDFEKPQEKLKS